MRSGAPSARATSVAGSISHRVARNDLEPAGPMRGDLLERGEATFVAFDRDDFLRALGEQRAGQAAGAGADFDDDDACKRAGGARDPSGQIEIEQEILAERLARIEAVRGDDFA